MRLYMNGGTPRRPNEDEPGYPTRDDRPGRIEEDQPMRKYPAIEPTQPWPDPEDDE